MKKEYKVSDTTGRILDLLTEFDQFTDKVTKVLTEIYGETQVDQIYEDYLYDSEYEYRENLGKILLLRITEQTGVRPLGPVVEI